MTEAGASSGDPLNEFKKPTKEVPVIQDEGFFTHDTGDTYEGYFEVKKKDRSAKMNGPGKYITAEGDVYSGCWEADKLGAKNEDVTITFKEGSKYQGPFRDWMYMGMGKYTYPDGSELECHFQENCPTAALILKDPNGHTWLGKADQGFGWFQPVNHYFEFINAENVAKATRKETKEKKKAK